MKLLFYTNLFFIGVSLVGVVYHGDDAGWWIALFSNMVAAAINITTNDN
jgi:hypothetical protein